MARLQILELPEGADDGRPPFVLVVDETLPQRVVIGMDHGAVPDYWQTVAAEIGARGVIVTPETVEIPTNEVLLPEPLELRYERDEMRRNYESACGTIADMHAAATGRAGVGPDRGVVEDVEDVRQRAEQAEDGRVAADNMLRAVCEVFGGPDRDPVVKARETLARAVRAERSERDLVELIGESRRSDVERMDQVTDALGLDRLRDWDEIVAAARRLRPAEDGETDGDGSDDAWDGHRFGVPGFLDPQRCAVCRIDRLSWEFRKDTRSCATVQADAESGHDFRPLDPGGLACLRCGMPRVKWAASLQPQDCGGTKEAG